MTSKMALCNVKEPEKIATVVASTLYWYQHDKTSLTFIVLASLPRQGH